MENSQVRICVPVCDPTFAEFERSVERALQLGNTVEFRLDCLDPSELDHYSKEIVALVRRHERIVVTLRPSEQGGKRALDVGTRERFWRSFDCPETPAALFDIELDLTEQFAVQSPPRWDWGQVICSHHDFQGVPENLEQLYERMARTPARILKVAVQANDITDCLAVFDLLNRAHRDGRELIGLAMGAAGAITRIMGPSRGAFLTYGALAAERGTAPGQSIAGELTELYRIQQIDRETEITGLVGLPVGHSVSPHIHNAAFAAMEMNSVYLPFEVRDVPAFIRRMVDPRSRELDWNLRGLSVTAPHKFSVMECLDWIEPAAKEIGAVNTIVVEDDALLGYNTDATAVLQPAIEKLGSVRGARCAVIGAGGAASATLWSLRNESANATLFARDDAKGRALAEKFDAGYESLGSRQWAGFDLVINATPLGTSGALEDLTAATADQLHGARLAYDLVYNPVETRFMREARAAGCEMIGGLPMLVLQAVEQFRLWTAREPPFEIMRQAAKRALEWQRAKS
jgi:3-dehydroquinate dehydratase/shikimate dehydrogenase